MARTASFKVTAAPSRLSQAMSKLSMKKLQQAVDERSVEDEGMHAWIAGICFFSY